jgi:hypothetical protein
MGMNPEVDVESLAREILRYLETHGEAADTVDGIARWWIKRQRLEETRWRVQRALDYLVGEARVQFKVSPAGQTLYMLAGDGAGATRQSSGGGPGEAAADPRPSEPGDSLQ